MRIQQELRVPWTKVKQQRDMSLLTWPFWLCFLSHPHHFFVCNSKIVNFKMYVRWKTLLFLGIVLWIVLCLTDILYDKYGSKKYNLDSRTGGKRLRFHQPCLTSFSFRWIQVDAWCAERRPVIRLIKGQRKSSGFTRERLPRRRQFWLWIVFGFLELHSVPLINRPVQCLKKWSADAPKTILWKKVWVF